MSATRYRRQLAEIFRAGLQRVDPYTMVREQVGLTGTILQLQAEGTQLEFDLDAYRNIYILGCGKATAPMAKAMEEILGPRLTAGVIVVKYGHVTALQTVQIIEAGHPVPDEKGVVGARVVMDLAAKAEADSLVINLISGGGSALLPLPAVSEKTGEELLSLADKQETTRQLLACGADISEINCIRKHLSAIKGGRLLATLAPATSINLILSDVVGDDLSSIASGLTAPDPTTYADALNIVQKYSLIDTVPRPVAKHLQKGMAGEAAESLKAGDAALDRTTNVLLGTNRLALNAAAERAGKLGYNVIRLTSRICGQAREVAKMLAAIAVDVHEQQLLAAPPLCIISGGEPVVTLRGTGKGGRNQELALAFLFEASKQPELFANIYFLAAATDGNDGPTDAAGGFADVGILAACNEKGIDLQSYLENNDAYTLFSLVDGLYLTGPTNTNVCDLHIALIP